MSYLHYLIETPYSWISLAGFFLGTSLSRVSRSVASIERRRAVSSRRVRRGAVIPERVRSRMWTLFYLGLSATLLCGLAAVFVPGPGRIVDPKLLWVAAVSTGIFFLMFRFKRSFGIPLLALLSAGALLSALALSRWTVDQGPSLVLQFRALDISASSLDLEITVPQNLTNQNAFVRIDSQTLQPRMNVLVLSDYYFLFGGKVAYRNINMNGQTTFSPQRAGAGGVVGRIADYLSNRLTMLPGITLHRVIAPSVRPFLLESISMTLSSDGSVHISPATVLTGS